MHGSYLGPEFSQAEIERRLRASARDSRTPMTTRAIAAAGADSSQRESAGLVSRPHGIRPARSGRPVHPRRRHVRPHAERCSISKSNIANRSGRSRRRCCASDVAEWFELDGDSPYMLLVADVAASTPPCHDRRGAATLRHRQTQRSALRHSRRHPRRLFRAHPDRAPGDQPALSRAALGIQANDRLPGHRQYQLQRPRRTHRLHARGRLPLLHGNRRSKRWRSATATSAKKTRTPPSSRITRPRSNSTERRTPAQLAVHYNNL